MIDVYIHLEKEDYSVEWIKWFIKYAIKKYRRNFLFGTYSCLQEMP